MINVACMQCVYQWQFAKECWASVWNKDSVVNVCVSDQGVVTMREDALSLSQRSCFVFVLSLNWKIKDDESQSSQGLTTNSGLCVVLDVGAVMLGRAREVGAGKMSTGRVIMYFAGSSSRTRWSSGHLHTLIWKIWRTATEGNRGKWVISFLSASTALPLPAFYRNKLQFSAYVIGRLGISAYNSSAR